MFFWVTPAELGPFHFHIQDPIWDAKMEYRIIPFLGEGNMTLGRANRRYTWLKKAPGTQHRLLPKLKLLSFHLPLTFQLMSTRDFKKRTAYFANLWWNGFWNTFPKRKDLRKVFPPFNYDITTGTVVHYKHPLFRWYLSNWKVLPGN